MQPAHLMFTMIQQFYQLMREEDEGEQYKLSSLGVQYQQMERRDLLFCYAFFKDMHQLFIS